MDNFRFWGLCRYKVCVNSCPLLDPCLPLPSHQVSVQAQEGDTVELPCKVRLSTEQSILPLLNNLLLTLIIVYFTSQTPLDFVLIFSLLLCFLKKLLFKLLDCSEKTELRFALKIPKLFCFNNTPHAVTQQYHSLLCINKQNKTKQNKANQSKAKHRYNLMFCSNKPPCILPQKHHLVFCLNKHLKIPHCILLKQTPHLFLGSPTLKTPLTCQRRDRAHIKQICIFQNWAIVYFCKVDQFCCC